MRTRTGTRTTGERDGTTTAKGGNTAPEEGEVVPYVPGSSDPAAEDPWDWRGAHRVEYHLVSTKDGHGARRRATSRRFRALAKRFGRDG